MLGKRARLDMLGLVLSHRSNDASVCPYGSNGRCMSVEIGGDCGAEQMPMPSSWVVTKNPPPVWKRSCGVLRLKNTGQMRVDDFPKTEDATVEPLMTARSDRPTRRGRMAEMDETRTVWTVHSGVSLSLAKRTCHQIMEHIWTLSRIKVSRRRNWEEGTIK